VHLEQPRDPVRNLALAAMFGYERGHLDGQSFAVLYPTMDEFLRTGDRIVPIMNAKGRYSDERIMRRGDGELFWCHVTGRALNRPSRSAPASGPSRT
jgi:PAS domain-containing protein